MKSKALFIPLHGGLLDEEEQLQPFAVSGLSEAVRSTDYRLVLLKDASCSLPDWLSEVLKSEHIEFQRTLEIELEQALPLLNDGYLLDQCYYVSNHPSPANEIPSIVLSNDTTWQDVAQRLLKQPRVAKVSRNTSETKIAIQLNLDGSGKANIHTGIDFFDHMLDQLARHGGLDLDIEVAGDLQIDEHHTIEDTALALGQAFHQALGQRKGINRYGFLLPMDDILAQVAIDFGGRPWLEWDANFRREKVGAMPAEMFSHFFKSFSDTAKCNLNISAWGDNEHHKIEAIFKAFARAIKMAITKSGDTSLPTTKGSLV